VNYWINIWNEINWIRPSLIIKSNRYNRWYDILVIPMTWW
jgi:mRNA-degrading endonuclease toxin of MazEF toxin-antitoxin module